MGSQGLFAELLRVRVRHRVGEPFAAQHQHEAMLPHRFNEGLHSGQRYLAQLGAQLGFHYRPDGG